MLLSEYALAVLQLSEIPIAKLIPRLGAISKGRVKHVNFSSFVFDRESFAPLLNALQKKECKLKSMKISFRSLNNLDNDSCKMLGRLLADTKVEIKVSRTVNNYDLQTLFNSMDTDGNGYLDEKNFLNGISNSNANSSIAVTGLSTAQKKRIFQEMAVRRPKQRDRVYFYDFYSALFAVNKDSGDRIDVNHNHPNSNFGQYDMTQLDYPMHDIIKEAAQLKDLNVAQIKSKFERLWKLFYLSISSNVLNEYSQPMNENIFFTFVNAWNQLEYQSKDSKIYGQNFLNELLDKITQESIFVSNCITILNTRNYLFDHKDLIKNAIEDKGMKREFVSGLMALGYSGLNIFEYCLAFESDLKLIENCTKHFVMILDLYLKYCDKNLTNDWYNLLFRKNECLYFVFSHVIAKNGEIVDSIFSYAVEHGFDNVINLFCHNVFAVPLTPHSYWWSNKESEYHVAMNDDYPIPRMVLYARMLIQYQYPGMYYVHALKFKTMIVYSHWIL